MMYWLPLRAHGMNCPVSSVKIWLMGTTWIPMEGGCPALSARATLGAASYVGDAGCMERCVAGAVPCAPTTFHQNQGSSKQPVCMRPGHDVYILHLMASSQVCLTGYPALACSYEMRAGV